METRYRSKKSSYKKKHNIRKRSKYLQSKLQLKDLRIVLHDVATNDLIPQHQRYLITKRHNDVDNKIMNNLKENANNTINQSNKQIDIENKNAINNNHNNELKCCMVKLYKQNFPKQSLKKNKKKNKRKNNRKKKNGKRLFDDRKYSSCVVNKQETSLIKPLSFNYNDDKQEFVFNTNDKYKCTDKHNNNIDNMCIVINNSDRNVSNNKVSIIDIDKKTNENDVNCQNDDDDDTTNNNIVNNDNLMINKINTSPKIIEDYVLHKNKIILMDNSNYLCRKDYYSMRIENMEMNKPPYSQSIELCNNVADLTIENLHKFTENYQDNYEQLQINKLTNVTYINSVNSINNNDKDMVQQVNKNNRIISYTKRKWLSQNGETQLNDNNKKFKLDRLFVKSKCVNRINNRLCINENSNSSFKYDHVNINANVIQDTDNNVTSSSFSNNNNNNNNNNINIDDNNNNKDNNNLCKVELMQKPNEIYCNTNTNLSNNSKINLENEKNESKVHEKYDKNVEHFDENNLSNEITICRTQLDYPTKIDNKTVEEDVSDDDDYISIYSNTSLILDDILTSCKKNIVIDKCKKNKIVPPSISNTSKQNNSLKCVKRLDTVAQCNITLNNKLTNLQKKNECKEMEKTNECKEMEKTNECKEIEKTNECKEIEKNNNSTTVKIITMQTNKSSTFNNKNKSEQKNQNNEVNSRRNTLSNDQNKIKTPRKVDMSRNYNILGRYCFQMMKDSFCKNNINKRCLFKHEIQELINYIIINYNKEQLTSILFHLCSLRYTYLLGELYIQIVDKLNIISILNIYKEFYLQEKPYLKFVHATVQALLKKGMSPKCVINELCQIIHCNDKLTLHYILILIKDRIKSYEYWDCLSILFKFIKPDKNIIERILNDCIINRQHVQDVNINLIQKLHTDEINQLDQNLLSSFNNLVLKHQCENIRDNLSSLYTVNNNNDERIFNNSYVSCSDNDLSDKFCSYTTLLNLKNKLLFGDYDYIINVLNNYQKTNQDVTCYRYCFQIFCTEINNGQYYVSKIIKHAIRTGANNEIIDVFVDIAVYILMKLVIKEIWILAYKLLKTLEMCIVDFDATFLLLSAEIYLANNQVNKAFLILKESNIISTNRQNWNVASKPEDCYLRTRIIQIILDALCEESSENAFFMFQFLTNDQNNNYEPIDLSQYVDKLMLTFLSTMKIQLVAAMGDLIIDYNFPFTNVIIWRAAITLLCRSDIILAKRLYQYATGFNIYEPIELSPVIHIPINIKWVEEELYLIFWDFFQRLSLNIRNNNNNNNSNNQIIKPKEELFIYIIFQELSMETLPYVKQSYNSTKTISFSQKLVRDVLDTWFDSSLTSTLKLNGNVMQLNYNSIINYLQFTLDSSNFRINKMF